LPASCSEAPRKIVTDELRSYPAANAEIAHVKHFFVKAGARLNNRAENSHPQTGERERRMLQPGSITGPRIAINLHANASVACAVFAT
jgi:transposase-like protein